MSPENVKMGWLIHGSVLLLGPHCFTTGVDMSILRHHSFAQEIDGDQALSWFQERDFMDSPPYFLTHWKTQKKFFCALGGLIAYEETPGELVVAGEPLLSDTANSREDVLDVFYQLAERKKKEVCGYYVGEDWESQHFSKVALGASSSLCFDNFDILQPRFREVRRSLRKGLQRNFSVVSINKADGASQQHLSRLFRAWKSGKPSVNIQFLLSEPQANHLVEEYEEWFAVEKNGEYLAFCSVLPYVKRGNLCFYLDNILHHPEKESHALSYLISFLVETFHEQGVYEFNMGLSPFANNTGQKSSWVDRAFRFLYRFPFLYQAKGLYNFKKKFGGVEKPEYCFFNHNQNKLRQLVEMAGVTFQWQ